MSELAKWISLLLTLFAGSVSVAAILAKAYKSKPARQSILPECMERFAAVTGRMNARDGDSKRIIKNVDHLESKFSSNCMALELRVNELESENGHTQKALDKITKTVEKMDRNLIRLMAENGIPELPE